MKREEKAVEDVKVAAESQKVAEAEKDVAEKTAEEEMKADEEVERERRLKQETDTVAVKVRKKTAAIAVETAVIATQKVAEEVTIECDKCNTLAIVETVTSKVCNDCLWIPAVVAKDRLVQKAAEAQRLFDAEHAAAEAGVQAAEVLKRAAEEERLKQEVEREGLAAEKIEAQKVAEEESLITAVAQNFFEELVVEIAVETAERFLAAVREKAAAKEERLKAEAIDKAAEEGMLDANPRTHFLWPGTNNICWCRFDPMSYFEYFGQYCGRCQQEDERERRLKQDTVTVVEKAEQNVNAELRKRCARNGACSELPDAKGRCKSCRAQYWRADKRARYLEK